MLVYKQIWKFQLQSTDRQAFCLPKGAEILTIQVQGGEPYFWALVDPLQEQVERFIEMYGTGHPVPFEEGFTKKYIGTYQLYNGSLVFHVFESIKE